MLTKWALKATTHNVRPVAWVPLAIGAGILAAIVDWRDPTQGRAGLVGLAIGWAYATVLGSSLRKVIDKQSDALRRLGQEAVPQASVPPRALIARVTLSALFVFAVILSWWLIHR
jgi:hypothetical protein